MRWPFTSSHPVAALPDETPVDPEISFTFKLFHELTRQDPTANIFFSPCSVMLRLAPVYDGATGETRNGMAKALQLPDSMPRAWRAWLRGCVRFCAGKMPDGSC
jgi:serine protease inhibitor